MLARTRERRYGQAPGLSVIVAVRDDEDSVGRDVRALVRHLRERGLRFEILAVGDGSHDTSLTLLRLLQVEIPELLVLGVARGGRGFRRATVHAHGDAVLLWDADRGTAVPRAILGWSLSRLARKDAVVVRGRFVLAHRRRCLSVLLDTVGHGDEYETRFERRAESLDLDVEIVGQRAPRRLGRWAPVLRILSV